MFQDDDDDDSDGEMDSSDLCLENYILETQVSEDNKAEEREEVITVMVSD